MHDQLESIEEGAYDRFMRYHEEGEKHYRLGMEKLVNRDFRRFTDFFNLSNIPLLFQVKPLAKHYAHMAAYFKNPAFKSCLYLPGCVHGVESF